MSGILKSAAIEITKLVLDKKHIHMKKLWEMVLGGLIVPAMVEDDKDIIEKTPNFKVLMEKYNKKAIKAFMKEAPKETIVEKEIRIEVPVEDNNTLFRRLKDSGINKISRKTRELANIERNAIIEWWNTNQRLMVKNDPVCAEIIDRIHTDGSRPISPLQISGFFSLICRKGLEVEADRDEYWNKRKREGNIDVVPVYSKEGLDAIQAAWLLNKKESAAIEKDHKELRDRRSAGDDTPLKVKRIKEATPVVLKADDPSTAGDAETGSSVEPAPETTGATLVPEHIEAKSTTEIETEEEPEIKLI